MSAPALTQSSEAVAGSPRLLDQVRTLALARFARREPGERRNANGDIRCRLKKREWGHWLLFAVRPPSLPSQAMFLVVESRIGK